MLRAISFSLVFVAASSAAEKIAAVVNGESIAASDLDAVVKQLPPSPDRQQQRADALQAMIDDALVRQFLKKHGPAVESTEVERQFAALEAAQKAIGKSIEEYLKETGQTAAKVRENLLRMLQLAKYADGLATIDRMKPYFDAHRDFFERVRVRTSHIVLRVPPTATAAERQKARETLKSIRSQLSSRSIEFAAAAKAYSQCPSAPKGGDVGEITRKFQADEAYAKAAFSMQVGEVSDVVETEVGYHLIWVTDRKPGKPTTYEQSARDVREAFEADLKQALLAELRSKGKIELK